MKDAFSYSQRLPKSAKTLPQPRAVPRKDLASPAIFGNSHAINPSLDAVQRTRSASSTFSRDLNDLGSSRDAVQGTAYATSTVFEDFNAQKPPQDAVQPTGYSSSMTSRDSNTSDLFQNPFQHSSCAKPTGPKKPNLPDASQGAIQQDSHANAMVSGQTKVSVSSQDVARKSSPVNPTIYEEAGFPTSSQSAVLRRRQNATVFKDPKAPSSSQGNQKPSGPRWTDRALASSTERPRYLLGQANDMYPAILGILQFIPINLGRIAGSLSLVHSHILKSCEPVLQPGQTRVRWRCVSADLGPSGPTRIEKADAKTPLALRSISLRRLC